MGQMQKRIINKTERVKGLSRIFKKKRKYIEKWDQTNSPEIPDRGETS